MDLPSSTFQTSQPLTSMPPLTYAAAGLRNWNLRPSSSTRNGGSTTARLPWYSTPMPEGTSLNARPLKVLVLTPRALGGVDRADRVVRGRVADVGIAGVGLGATAGTEAGTLARSAARRTSSMMPAGRFGRPHTLSTTADRSPASTSRNRRVSRAAAQPRRVGPR